MPRSSKEEFKVNERREKVAELRLQGKTLSEIGAVVGVSKSVVHRDLQAIEAEWKAAALRDFDAAKAEQIARIQVLFRTYWDAWHASCQPSKSEHRKTARSGKGDGPGSERMEVHISTKTHTGDPRYLDGVRWCITKICDLMGLNAPVQVDLGAGVLVIHGADPARALGQVLDVPTLEGSLQVPEALPAPLPESESEEGSE